MTTPAVGARHTFKLRLMDVDGKALKGVRCDVDTDKETIHLGIVTDASGMLSLTVPAKKLLFLTVHLFPDPLTMRLEVETVNDRREPEETLHRGRHRKVATARGVS